MGERFWLAAVSRRRRRRRVGGSRGIHFRGRGGACRPDDKTRSGGRRIATVDLEPDLDVMLAPEVVEPGLLGERHFLQVDALGELAAGLVEVR
jgi:hypothetical protein